MVELLENALTLKVILKYTDFNQLNALFIGIIATLALSFLTFVSLEHGFKANGNTTTLVRV